MLPLISRPRTDRIGAERPGLGRGPRVELPAGSWARWQWSDGGWNCDAYAHGRRSSVHESLAPAGGLFQYWRATGRPARVKQLRTAELFLQHRLFRSLATAQVIRRGGAYPHSPRGTGTMTSSKRCSCSPACGSPVPGGHPVRPRRPRTRQGRHHTVSEGYKNRSVRTAGRLHPSTEVRRAGHYASAVPEGRQTPGRGPIRRYGSFDPSAHVSFVTVCHSRPGRRGSRMSG